MKKTIYYAIAAFKSLDHLKNQMVIDRITECDIKKIRFDDGLSLLEVAIANRQYDICNYLLDIDSPVNIVTKSGNNELGIISPNLHDINAVSIANRLLEKGVDLSLIDKKYGNTVMFSITLHIITHANIDNILFLEKCLRKGSGIYEKNKNHKCVIDILNDYKQKLDEININKNDNNSLPDIERLLQIIVNGDNM